MTYVISDIHGNMDTFFRTLKKIEFKDEDTLYILGDVVDRGPRGIELLQYIMQQSNIHMLIGNHEYMLLNCLENPSLEYMRLWNQNGGDITFRQFSALEENQKSDILDFIKTLPVNIEVLVGETEYLLVHACPVPSKYGNMFYDPNIYRYADDKEYAVWNRHIPDKIEGKTIIFGHTPTLNYRYGYKKPRVIYFSSINGYNIDCGAAYPEFGGRMACMRLEDKKIFYMDLTGFDKDFKMTGDEN